MIWDKIKSAILVDEEASTPTAAAQAPATSSPGGKTNPLTPEAGANAELVTKLRGIITGRVTAFTALLQAADKLAGIIPDPSTRLKAAYATVSGEGRGMKEVLSAIEIHASDLEGQRMQFEAALERQKQTAVGRLQAELKSISSGNDAAQQQIAAMTTQIQQLQQQIASNNTKASELHSQLASEEARLSSTANEFELALNAVKHELEVQRSTVMTALS